MKKIREMVLGELECLNRGDLDGVCAFYTDDVVFGDIGDPDHPAVGMAAFKESMSAFFTGFSDLNVNPQRFLFTEDDNVCALEYILTGTQDGPFAGVEPSGKKMETLACSVYEKRGDLFCKEVIYWDIGYVLSQLK